MKQARRWLLLSAAIVLVPTVALAQKKKPAQPAAAPAAGTPAAPADADADQPSANPAPTAAPADTGTAGATGAGAGGETDICKITPDAPECGGGGAQPLDLGAAAKKEVTNREIYAVTQIYALKYHRFEINPYWSFTLNDQFVSHPGPGLAINYYITNVLAIGVSGNYYYGLNVDSDFNFQNRRAARIAVPLNEYREAAVVNFTYVPVYGKFAGFGDFIFNYDAYLLGGVGEIDTRPIAVIDPDNRVFSFKPKVTFDLGIGLRIFFNRWLTATLEVRDYIYNEQLEALTIAPTQTGPNSATDPNTWFGDSKLTNNVQAQLGVSIFLPFAFDYRLPK
jgi:outer membrane beta-barrel protein